MSSPVVPSIEFPTPAFLATSAVPRAQRRQERRIKGITWRWVGRRASTRRNDTTSLVWDHGDGYININRPSMPVYWVCDYCDTAIKPQSSGSTANVRRHLQLTHTIDLAVMRATTSDVETDTASQVTSVESTPILRQFSALCTSINADRFRLLLLRLFITCQLAFSIVERSEWRELFSYIQPSIERYMPKTHKSIRAWVVDEYKKGQVVLTSLMAQAKSRIHISFDIWSTPSGTPILGICGHFLDSSLQLRHPLLALRFLPGSHTGVAMAEIIQAVMENFGIVDKWGVCVSDNAENNDTTCKALVEALRPNESTTARRARCFGHMVNLAAKAFIYGQRFEGFIVEAESIATLTTRDQLAVQAEMAHWRQRGSFGKFHNVVKWVRAGTLRRQRFEGLLKGFLRPKDDVPLTTDLVVDGKWNSLWVVGLVA